MRDTVSRATHRVATPSNATRGAYVFHKEHANLGFVRPAVHHGLQIGQEGRVDREEAFDRVENELDVYFADDWLVRLRRRLQRLHDQLGQLQAVIQRRQAVSRPWQLNVVGRCGAHTSITVCRACT